MKRMISFTRGVRSAYVLPQKGGTVLVFEGALRRNKHLVTVCLLNAALFRAVLRN